MSTLVEMKGVVKKFPGVTALKDISFDIQAGEVHVLLGENGAGKSTLMKILSGVYQPTEGKIIIGGKEFSKLTPKDSYENGISVIYQELSVINELSIQENLFVGKLPMKKVGLASVVDYGEMNRRAKELLAKIGLNRDPKTLVEDISVSEKQQVEIAKALASDSKVIVMDEPTVGVDAQSREHIMNSIKRLRESGATVIYTSHYMHEVEEICDRVAIIDKGRLVAEGTQQELITMITDSCTVHITTKSCDGETRSRVSRAISNLPDVNRAHFEENVISVDMSISCNDISHVISELVNHNLPVLEVNTEKPDMDTVFLSLTGHEIR